MSQVILYTAKVKDCKHSDRMEAIEEPQEFKPDNPTTFYVKKEIMAALGNPTRVKFTLEPA
jgi:hypothetical protein